MLHRTCTPLTALIIGLTCFFVALLSASADSPSEKPDPASETSKLERRVAELEAQLATLLQEMRAFRRDLREVVPAGKTSTSLAEAVSRFNAGAAEHPVGKHQPLLTEDEVVASIRCWVRDRQSVSDNVYAEYQRIAETRQMPEGARLSYSTGCIGPNGFEFDVWWVDLRLPTAKGLGYVYRIRDQKIRSRPRAALGQELQKKPREVERKGSQDK